MNIDRRICTFCGEDIASDFKRCPYCGSLLEMQPANSQDEKIEIDTVSDINYMESNVDHNEQDKDEQENAYDSTQKVHDSTENTNIQFAQEQKKLSETLPKDQYNQYPKKNSIDKEPLSNGKKVFITSICNMIPGIGQIIGVILAIVFMNSEGDTDRKSFGFALLLSSLIVFVITSISCCIFFAAISNSI